MISVRVRAALAVAAIVLAPSVVSAHVFLQPYTLPVPFWLYVYGCAATLIVSFAVVAALVGGGAPGSVPWERDILPATPAWQAAWRWKVRLLRAIAMAALLLTVTAGFVGSTNPGANINMTLFWVVFLLAFTYVTAIAGNIFRLVNPWATLVSWIEALGVNLTRPRLEYPRWLGYLPALAFYMALIWIELFTLPMPQLLSEALLVYTAATLLGVLLFGKRAWFEYGELFSIFFAIAGAVSPVDYQDASHSRPARVRLRAPLAAMLERGRGSHPTLVLFVLFMLSSTTYDAIHETYLWVSIYWQNLLPLVGALSAASQTLTTWYLVYQRLGLVLSPFFYLALYLIVLGVAGRLTKVHVWRRAIAVPLAFSLVPIALVYHATHYYTILLTEMPKLLPLASDPFGLGWRLFAVTPVTPGPLNMGTIWHTQVALILVGHVAGVYAAHVMALRLLPSKRLGIVSQIPMLVLMVAYTCIGLWVLSLPLGVPQVLPMG